MGLCGGEAEVSSVSKQIDADLRAAREEARKQIKVLLLGAGESGKSTILKQMRIIHGEGYNDADREKFKHIIHANITNSMRTLCTAAIDKEGEDVLSELKEERDTLVNYDTDLFERDEAGPEEFNRLSGMISKLWATQVIQDTYERRAEFQLTESCKYFMEKLDDVSTDGYIPSAQDVLRSRVQTSGIIENEFGIGKRKFQMIDVGGQRAERRKWIHCFEGVTAILFIVASSAFNQVLQEDAKMNRMEESYNLFNTISSSPFFKNTTVILFFNKADVLKEKLEKIQFKSYFQDYEGENDLNSVQEYIRDYFLAYDEEEEPEEEDKEAQEYHHFTNATDTDLIKKVFSSVADTIIQGHLKGFGLI